MNKTTLSQMNEELRAFCEKHNYDFKLYQTNGENGSYHKEYVFEDGAVWYEHNQIVTYDEEIVILSSNAKAVVPVTYFETEYWSTESSSKYVYQLMKVGK